MSEGSGWTRRTFLERSALAATAFTVPVALGACGTAGGEEGVREVAFSHANSGTPVATAVQQFATERAKEVEAKMLFGNPQLREDTQVQEIQTWITQAVPAMCVFPVVVESVLPLVQRARDKDLIFTSYALKLDGANGAVLFSHEESGKALGEHAVGWINNNLGGRGKALLLGAKSASPDLQPRVEIPRRLLKEQTEVRIVGEQDATDPTKGLQVTEAVLRSHPDLDIVVGLNDDGALGAMRAFINAGKDPSKVYIGGQDGGFEALQAIKDGGFYKASAALSLRDIGRAVVDLNAKLLDAGGGESDAEVPIKLIAQDRTEHLAQALEETGAVTVELRGLVKTYGAVRALRGVDLTIEPGSAHALLGPNGAGKSTLIGCMSGAVRPDAGVIVLGATAHDALTPRAALAAGVSVIYQKFSLVGALSVEDNVFLGSELTRWGLRRRRQQRRMTGELLARLQRALPVAAPVGSLPIADRQLVEIAKALRHGSQVLVFDEPTASLSRRETGALLEQIRALRATGMHILYVTHRLDEVLDVADHVTVLRDGAVVASRPVAGMSIPELVRAVTGMDHVPSTAAPPPAAGRPLLELHDATANGLGPLSFTLREGELLGVFGMLGSGRTELLETLFGTRPLRGGRIDFQGRELGRGGPAARIASGIALVPAERVRQSLFMSLTALENVLLPSLRRLAMRVLRLRRRRAERRQFDAVAGELRLTPAAPRTPASSFSGGNQQKLAVGRWLAQPETLRVLLLDEPTQGIDVGARAELYRILERTAAERRCGVVFTSSEPEEVLRLAHRALVLERGRVVAELSGEQIAEEALMAAANAQESDEGNVP